MDGAPPRAVSDKLGVEYIALVANLEKWIRGES